MLLWDCCRLHGAVMAPLVWVGVFTCVAAAFPGSYKTFLVHALLTSSPPHLRTYPTISITSIPTLTWSCTTQATTDQCTAVPSTCSLLGVPGEIRNKIYGFAMEESLDSLKDKYSAKLTEAEADKVSYYAHRNRLSFGYLWSAQRRYRQYWRLTQVCRLIRSEFLPVYNARTQFSVRLDDLQSYIDTFVRQPGVADEDAVGQLAIVSEIYTRVYIDLSSLVTLVNTMKHLHISAPDGTRYPSSPHCTEVLFRLDDYPSFRDYFQQAVVGIHYKDNFGAPKFRFEIKQGHWEGWMGWDRRLGPRPPGAPHPSYVWAREITIPLHRDIYTKWVEFSQAS
ncbi:hypothetical protein C7974DRAFT_212608 [Boeremia exigua]|uniref:uncharacterized protein n=1 Tax=Boeremia exigua TaxID=749465 RepID=UPI001E8D4DBA|nr:uncharacterized protein C7974DRAFT_212608 [Boeremia exigua]KAH6621884.1 hypothetical protein C7974DRAFT_212608 [Boeremia exigua]